MPVSFGPPGKQLNTFGVDADGWSSQDIYPRLLADIDNDGKADIVGFGHDGVITSLANGTGGFSQQALVGNTANWGTFSGG
jgi:hypothetical protein